MSTKNKLDSLQIASPCSASWESMSGDDQKRYCAECARFVYDFSKMTRRRAEAVVAASRGRLCARLTKKPDGSLLTLEPDLDPHRPDYANRRASPIAGAIISALLGLNAPMAALANASAPPAPVEATDRSDQDARKTDSKSQPGNSDGSINGQVVDPHEALIANAVITLTSAGSGEKRTTRSSDKGEYSFQQLPPGSYSLRVESPGFKALVITDIAINAAGEIQINAAMEVSASEVLTGVVAGPAPQPLRPLYQRSDLIAIVNVGESVVARTEDETRLMKTALRLSSTLKGENRGRAVDVYHWVYDESEPGFTSGDTLLVFLNRRKDDHGNPKDGYEVNEHQYGVKKLDGAALGVYRQRIEELAALLRPENPDPARIIEWLVRCAEDPATRWEGAFELANSGSGICLTKPDDRSGDEADPETKDAERKSVETEDADRPTRKDAERDASLASMLIQEQKDRLATALFNSGQLAENDADLIQLVSEWNDPRFIPFLAAQLRRIAHEAPPLAELLVSHIAEALDDPEVGELAEDYSGNLNYADLGRDEADPEWKEKRKAEASEALASRVARLAKFLAAVESKIGKS